MIRKKEGWPVSGPKKQSHLHNFGLVANGVGFGTLLVEAKKHKQTIILAQVYGEKGLLCSFVVCRGAPKLQGTEKRGC